MKPGIDVIYSLKEVAEKMDITEKTLKQKAAAGELMFPLVPMTLKTRPNQKPRLVVYAEHFEKAAEMSAKKAMEQYQKDQENLRSHSG